MCKQIGRSQRNTGKRPASLVTRRREVTRSKVRSAPQCVRAQFKVNAVTQIRKVQAEHFLSLDGLVVLRLSRLESLEVVVYVRQHKDHRDIFETIGRKDMRLTSAY